VHCSDGATLYDGSMEAPAVTRHRRPFLAPLWLTLLAGITLGAIALGFYRTAATTVVVLVRSPEKEPGTIADPPISSDGEARAQRLARTLAGSGVRQIEAIYVSDDRLAQQTAAPAAERLQRTPVLFNRSEVTALGTRVVREHGGGIVVIIGGGTTVPQLVQSLSGAQVGSRPGADPDCLYIVSVPTLGRAQLLALKF
jgi:broad specificity phosphatase PhoE